VFPILTQSFIQSLFPILTNPIPIVTPTICQSLIEEKNALGKLPPVEGNLHFFFFLHRYLQNGDRKPKSMSNHGWSSQPEIHVAMLVADKTSDSSNDA
jgi:hypothetical protein